jgi:hypothetical protein
MYSAASQVIGPDFDIVELSSLIERAVVPVVAVVVSAS